MTGEELREARTARGLKQVDLAERLGVSQASIARWETGEAPIGGPQEIAIRSILSNGTGKVPAKQKKNNKRVS